jgi:hypothetical protein
MQQMYRLGQTIVILTIVLACLIRVSVSFGFAIEPLYANEVYPTVVRTIGSGFVFSFVTQFGKDRA